MKRRFDYLTAIILVLLLVITIFVGNAIVKGILLLVFSGTLIMNTELNLRVRQDNKLNNKIFLGVLIGLEAILAISSLYVIFSALFK